MKYILVIILCLQCYSQTVKNDEEAKTVLRTFELYSDMPVFGDWTAGTIDIEHRKYDANGYYMTPPTAYPVIGANRHCKPDPGFCILTCRRYWRLRPDGKCEPKWASLPTDMWPKEYR